MVYNTLNEAAGYSELEALKEKWKKSIPMQLVTGRITGMM